MGKIIPLLLVLLLVLFIPAPAVADSKEAGASARLQAVSVVDNSDHAQRMSTHERTKTKHAIRKVLAHNNSPMIEEADAFMRACIKYDIDCYLLPAIAGLESGFGRAIWPGSNNPFGWGGGYIMFDSWEDGIDAVARGLRRGYVATGTITPDMIGHKYSASGTWATRVYGFMGQFERAATNNALHSVNLALQ